MLLSLYHSHPTGPDLLWDHTVKMWDCASGVPIATLKGHSMLDNQGQASPCALCLIRNNQRPSPGYNN